MNKKWRLILDGKCNGYYNMAVDEAIFSLYSALKIPTLRIYGWSEPFLSLGYNQEQSEVLKPKVNIPFVRRITGGAAILHDCEITYSLTCSLSDLGLPREVKKSYEVLNSFIKEFYKRLGLEAQFAKDIFSAGLGRRENFCFAACEDFDFVVNGKKIGGNAQRRKKDLVFQHGSIPREIDFELIENSINNAQGLSFKATFLNELLPGGSLDADTIISTFYAAFESVFKVKFSSERLSSREREASYCLMETKYTTKEWNLSKIHKPVDAGIYEKVSV